VADCPHVQAALDYAHGVIDGAIPNCAWVVRACERFLNDLAESDTPGHPYYFDVDEAERVCRFIEALPHVKGKWAAQRQMLILAPWQSFIVCNIFGWRRHKDGLRRFRSAYLRIPRKNGKSVLAAAIGLALFCADGEHGAEVYSGATTERQAWEVFRPARLMAEKTPDLLEAAGIEVLKASMVIEADFSRFEPVIGKPGDGASPHAAIVDEYHEHAVPDLVDTMQTGMGAREQPLLLIITTAGDNLAGPCYEHEQGVKKILEGVIDDPEAFGLLYGIDDADDWTDPAALRKANPNYGVSVFEDFLIAQQRAAIMTPATQARFKTKHLNAWCGAGSQLIPLAHWQRAADPLLMPADLAGCECFGSLDMASKIDLCAASYTFRKYLDGKPHYYLFGRYWLPQETIEAPGKNRTSYERWVREGHLTPTLGAVVDFGLITEQVAADLRTYGAREFIFDPFNAQQVALDVGEIVGDSLDIVEFQQKPWNFALPVDDFIAALVDGRVHHDGNPVTTWCLSNVVGKPSTKGLHSPVKQAADQKIDGAIAIFMGMSRAAVRSEEDKGISGWLNNPVL
jgi:phage terminase large subunit-like protein